MEVFTGTRPQHVGAKASDYAPTKEAAALIHVKPQTMRAGYCHDGEYMGLVPVKLPNGRLLWPLKSLVRLVNGEAL